MFLGNKYSAADIERYHAGKMSAAEMHALEKAALDDPFLADALEGYLHTPTPAADLEAIRKRLQEKTTQKRVVPLFFRHNNWMKAAAVILVVAGSLWLISRGLENNDRSIALEPQQTTGKKSAESSFDSATGSPQTSTAATGESSIGESRNGLEGNKSRSDAASGKTSGTQNQTAAAVESRKKENLQEPRDLNPPPAAEIAANQGVEKLMQDKAVRLEEQKFYTLTDSSKDVSLSSRRSGAPVNDTIHNVDVVLKEQPSEISEVVVTGAGKNKMANRARQQYVIDTLEPAEGWAQFNDYIARNLRAPEEINSKPTGGEVQLSFDINQKGEAVNIKVDKSLCAACDEEAIRLLKEGPKWKRKKNRKGRIVIRF